MIKVEIDKKQMDNAFSDPKNELIGRKVRLWFGEDITLIDSIKTVLIIEVDDKDDYPDRPECDRGIKYFNGENVLNACKEQIIDLLGYVNI